MKHSSTWLLLRNVQLSLQHTPTIPAVPVGIIFVEMLIMVNIWCVVLWKWYGMVDVSTSICIFMQQQVVTFDSRRVQPCSFKLCALGYGERL
jgi:hypothetical protein